MGRCRNLVPILLLLAGAVHCAEPGETPVFELCENGLDDDGDGVVDCLDADCSFSAFCGGDGGTKPPLALQTVVNGMTLPMEGTDFAIDLDDDGMLDNQVGRMLAALKAVNPMINLQKELDNQLSLGKLLLLHEIFADSLVDSERMIIRSALGEDTDDQPGNNFSGQAELAILKEGTSLQGKIVAGQLEAGPGELASPVIIGQYSVQMTLLNARLGARVQRTGLENGIIAGAIPMKDVDDALVPALTEEINRIYHDPKTSDQNRQALHDLFDKDNDDTITLEEMRSNPVIEQLLKTPDVDTDGDHVADAMSMGLGFTAVTCRIPEG